MSYPGNYRQKDIVSIVAGVAVTSSNSYVRIGSFLLDDTNKPNYDVQLIFVGETTNVVNACEFRLYDVTGAAVVGPDPVDSIIALTPTLVVVPMTLLYGWPSGPRLYELQMLMAAGVGPDAVTCSHARIEAQWSDF